MSTKEGPKVHISVSCSGCSHLDSKYYAVQSDSGFEHTCSKYGKYLGYGTSTPDWCEFYPKEYAAAPELLEALENMAEQAEFKKSVTGSYGHFADSVVKAQAAIAKALGGSTCATEEQKTVHPSNGDS